MTTETSTLADVLSKHTQEGELYEKLSGGRVRCFSCGHRCLIPEGRLGICKVRFNHDGSLMVPWGYVGALQCDPIEKKPFFHAMPGTDALSFGMLGCDFHCSYCQNWLTSQTLRDPRAVSSPMLCSSEELVRLARRYGASTLASTYNEPLITSEWAVEIFRRARPEGLHCAYISNGNGTTEVLEYIRPYVDLYKVDLKSFRDKNYRALGGVLANVLETIQSARAMGFWVEVVTLIVPGFNDSDEELKDIARFLASVSSDIPWHVTAFHKDYRMTGPDNTTVEVLLRAAEIGASEGLDFVYAGNLPGRAGRWENTFCPGCNELLIERVAYTILRNVLQKGSCPSCQKLLPGVWK
jgi:pyruvate formate lyase activating enzyme